MTTDDLTLRRVLTAEALLEYEDLSRVRSPLATVIDAFRSSDRPLVIASWIGGLLMLVLAVYAATRFWAAPDTRQMLVWAGLTAFAVFSLGLIKIWFWMEVQKTSVVRGLRRVELQISGLLAMSPER